MTEEEIKVKIKLELDENDVSKIKSTAAQSSKKSGKDVKEDQELEETVSQVQEFVEGNVGDVQKFTSQQMTNLNGFVRNPFQFVVSSIFRKFTKGAGIAALAVIFFELVKTIIEELFKPGRAYDVRFRERINKQVILFLERKEQQELKQKYKQLITTTIGGLRGSQLAGHIGGNFYNPDRIPVNFIDTRRALDDNYIAQDARTRSNSGMIGSRNNRKGFSGR